MKPTRFPPIIIAGLLMLSPLSHGADWSEPSKVLRRGRPVVEYRAKLQGGVLVVEGTHRGGWHTYALDNVERARARTGQAKPETELPTRIALSGGLKVVGHWYQTKPKELSMPEIKWYTWGFEEKAVFAARVERADGERAIITVNAQACNASSCSMVEDLRIELPLPKEDGDESFDLSNLVPGPTVETVE